ncbi:MAG: 4-hydroxyproline epimerase [Cytophagales bacterium]|nr:4-hydroxyproline epimerase [Cytophagales bacterium]
MNAVAPISLASFEQKLAECRLPGDLFYCINAHTEGNPVRLIASGGPALEGDTMAEKRLHFLRKYDWIREGLMFEPRGHDMMSGSILYPPHKEENDVAVLFIETSGCLPMCGHGTIGTITIAIEYGLIEPKKKGEVRMETPAGLVKIKYHQEETGKVKWVKLTNVPSYLSDEELEVNCPTLGKLTVDVAYGGNFYAIVDVQENFPGLEHFTASDLVSWARAMRKELNEQYAFIHPVDKNISGLSHIEWTGATLDPGSSGRNAVFYGDKAIDRSPCGTGTSARLAQLYAKGKLKKGEEFIHESIIGSKFIGIVEEEVTLGNKQAIIPSIQGSAVVFGEEILSIDPKTDIYSKGFQVI